MNAPQKDTANSVPLIVPESSIATNTAQAKNQAHKESTALGLDNVAKKTLDGLINRAIFWCGHIALLGAGVVLLCRILHFILPDKLHWLTELNLKEIDHLFLGIATGLMARYWPSAKKEDE